MDNIEAIFNYGFIWFKGTIVKNNGYNNNKENEYKMAIRWKFNDTITETILQSMKDSNDTIIENKYKIIYIPNPYFDEMINADNNEIQNNNKNNKFDFSPEEEIETNYLNDNFPLRWEIATFDSYNINDNTCNILINGIYYSNINTHLIRKKGILNENITFKQEENSNDTDETNSIGTRNMQNYPISRMRRGDSFNTITPEKGGYTYTPARTKKFTYIPEEDVEPSELSVSDISGNPSNKKSHELITYKKYTYKEVEKEIHDNYFDEGEYHSSALDILATYLKGQKLIYMESKAYCENWLNLLMMPAILLSTAATVLSSIMKDFYWGAYFISGINGIIAFMLAVVNYLKLDATSEAHKIAAHQYDKLQTSIEFLSGTTLLFNNINSTSIIEKKIDETEKKLMKLKRQINLLSQKI